MALLYLRSLLNPKSCFSAEGVPPDVYEQTLSSMRGPVFPCDDKRKFPRVYDCSKFAADLNSSVGLM